MSYDGGKGGAGVYQWIINQIPPHRRYIDLFLGNSAVLRHKRPALLNIGIEINRRVIDEYWRGVPGVTILPGDALERLSRLDCRSDDFVYADPPYLMETRSDQRQLYAFEFAEREQHITLLTALSALPCMIAISGYWSELYATELADWRTSTFQTVNHAGKPATEWLWMNYPKPLELHDYRYLGRDFRERERIKRKKWRWTERLRSMPDLERYALMEAIEGLRSGLARTGDIDEGHQVAPPDLTMAAPTAGHDDASWPASADLAMVDR
jgi:hypothetical protein